MQNRETLEVLGYEKASFRYSSGSTPLQLSAELSGGDFAREKCLERGSDVLNVLRRFVHELETEVANACGAPGIHVRTRFLRLRTEYCISTANVGHYRMRASLWISHGHSMPFAWPPAIAIG